MALSRHIGPRTKALWPIWLFKWQYDLEAHLGHIITCMYCPLKFTTISLFWYMVSFQVIIALVLMYFKLGVSAVLGGLLIIVAAPVQIFIGRGMSNMQKKVMVSIASIHFLRRRNTKGSTCLLRHITTEKSGLCQYAVYITRNTTLNK